MLRPLHSRLILAVCGVHRLAGLSSGSARGIASPTFTLAHPGRVPPTAIPGLAPKRYIHLQFLFRPTTLTSKSACLIYAEPIQSPASAAGDHGGGGNSKTASQPEFGTCDGTSSENLVPKNYCPSPVGISKSW